MIVVLICEPLRTNPKAKDAALVWLYAMLCGGTGLAMVGAKRKRTQKETANKPDAGDDK